MAMSIWLAVKPVDHEAKFWLYTCIYTQTVYVTRNVC